MSKAKDFRSVRKTVKKGPAAIIFSTPGRMDISAVRLFGASVKEQDNPIGMFGTGLKYALAVLMREGAEVEIRIGEEVHPVSVQTTVLRGEEFKEVCLGGQPLGFTTRLGMNWQMWQAYRELYCNTLDEAGTVFESWDVEGLPPNGHDWTQIRVSGCREFSEVHAMRSTWFLDTSSRTPLFVCPTLEVYPGSSGKMFYRGVAVRDLPNPSQFTYNFLLRLDLTEDRTAANEYLMDSYIKTVMVSHEGVPDVVMRAAFAGPRDSYEGRQDYLWFCPPFKDSALKAIEKLSKDAHINPSAWQKYRMEKPPSEASFAEITEDESRMIAEAVRLLVSCGLNVKLDSVRVSEELPDATLGTVLTDRIILNRRTFLMGQRMVSGTVLEEYLHISSGVADETRGMQNLLIDMLVSYMEKVDAARG